MKKVDGTAVKYRHYKLQNKMPLLVQQQPALALALVLALVLAAPVAAKNRSGDETSGARVHASKDGSVHVTSPNSVFLEPGYNGSVFIGDVDVLSALYDLRAKYDSLERRLPQLLAQTVLDCSSDSSRQQLAALGVTEVSGVVDCCCDLVHNLTRVNGDVRIKPGATAVDLGQTLVEIAGNIDGAGTSLFRNSIESLHMGRVTRVGGSIRLEHNLLSEVDFGPLAHVGGDVLLLDNKLRAFSFANITQVHGTVDLRENQLSVLDFSAVTYIKGDVGCNDVLTSVDFGSLRRIDGLLHLGSNRLTITLNNLTHVGETLYLNDNDFTSLSLGNLSFVGKTLHLARNFLTAIDFGQLTHVGGSILALGNRLSSLDYGRIPSVTGTLDLSDNLFTAIDVEQLPDIGRLDAANNPLRTFSLGSLDRFTASLDLHSTDLSSFDFGSVTDFYGNLDLSFNQLTRLDFKQVTRIVGSVQLQVNKITAGGLSALPDVGKTLDLSLNELRNITLYGVTALQGDLLLHGNPLRGVDFGTLTQVTGAVRLTDTRLDVVTCGEERDMCIVLDDASNATVTGCKLC